MEDYLDPSKLEYNQDRRKTVLFLCTHNSARSQMAEGLLMAKFPSKYIVYSAGTHPTLINPLAIQVMTEIGINISSNMSKSLEKFLDITIDFVVTVCDTAKENCPFFPGARNYIHKSFEDPASLAEFRRVRDQIKSWVFNQFK
jgi:arsenate reductase